VNFWLRQNFHLSLSFLKPNSHLTHFLQILRTY
jgi:hypothetical protein